VDTDHELFGGLLRDLEEGYAASVGFIVPPVVAWPLPAYELALMTAWETRGMGADVDVWWPPTKVAGRYLSPYLGAIEDAEVLGTEATPDGHPVELDLAH
jgi:hypothetical protein